MRHRKRTAKLGRNTGHRRSLMANMLKALITNGRVETTVAKAKELRRHADRMVTMAKKGTLAHMRLAMGKMMVTYNKLSPKQARRAKEGNTSSFNDDRLVMQKLNELAGRFEGRQGGYTRIMRSRNRVGDNAPICLIEFLGEKETLKSPEKAESEKAPAKKETKKETASKVEAQADAPKEEAKAKPSKEEAKAEAPKEEKKEEAKAEKPAEKKAAAPKKTAAKKDASEEKPKKADSKKDEDSSK